MSREYIKSQQKEWERMWRLQEDLEAREEAERVAKMEAEARELKEIAERKKLLLEQQENERLRRKRIQREENLAEQRWVNQHDTLVAQIKDRFRRETDKLEKIRFIVQNREPSLQVLDWASWLLSDPLNQQLADLDLEQAMAMYKRDNLMAKRRRGTRGKKKVQVDNYALSFTGDTADGARLDYVSTTFDPQAYSLNAGFTVSLWVRPDEIPVATTLFAFGRNNNNNKERFTFGLQNASKLFLGVGKQKKTSTDHGMEVNNWYHWVITFAGGTNGALIAYRDGDDIDLAADGNGTSTWINTDTSFPIFFGGRNAVGDYDQGWACTLSHMAIFDEVKDSDWVTSIYNAGRTGTNHTGKSNLVGYWKLNEGSGTTVKDHSENDNHGTLTSDTGDGGSGTPTWKKIKK
jgi:hypothetical protein